MAELPSVHWSEIVKAKRAAREALIPPEWRIPPTTAQSVLDVPRTCGILTDAELAITEMEAPELVETMSKGELKSYDVMLAFCKRAAVAHQLTNCLTEILFTEALATASALDAKFVKDGKPMGALHGLPVSLKDNFNIAGVDSTVGLVAWANDPATAATESEIVKIMRECGAVLFCKTNVPTAMLMVDPYNNVWGYTSNPHNHRLSAGGSSGGEAALIAMKGSPLGLGTDIGGSIRIPSSFCGLFGLKASFGRFPTYGSKSGLPGQEAIRSVNGPISRSVGGIEMWCKAVVGAGSWTRDPSVLPIPWREVNLPDRLCFGLLLDNGIVKPTPPVTRALLETKAALEAAGHTVIEWSPHELQQGISLIQRFLQADGGHSVASALAASGEAWPASLWGIEELYNRHKDSPPLVKDTWRFQAERATYCKKMLDKWMMTQEVTGTGRPMDGLVTPASPWAASPRHTFRGTTYTSIWNLCDQTACVFPVTMVDVAADVKPAYEARNQMEKDIWDRYDADELIGNPVGLQLVCQRLEEEKALELVKVIMASLRAAKSSTRDGASQ